MRQRQKSAQAREAQFTSAAMAPQLYYQMMKLQIGGVKKKVTTVQL